VNGPQVALLLPKARPAPGAGPEPAGDLYREAARNEGSVASRGDQSPRSP